MLLPTNFRGYKNKTFQKDEYGIQLAIKLQSERTRTTKSHWRRTWV